MKNLKKLGASLLALVLALGMVAPAMASQGSGSDNPPQPTQIKLTTSGQGHTFTAYQIFKAAGSDATSLNLATLDWGPSVTIRRRFGTPWWLWMPLALLLTRRASPRTSEAQKAPERWLTSSSTPIPKAAGRTGLRRMRSWPWRLSTAAQSPVLSV